MPYPDFKYRGFPIKRDETWPEYLVRREREHEWRKRRAATDPNGCEIVTTGGPDAR